MGARDGLAHIGAVATGLSNRHARRFSAGCVRWFLRRDYSLGHGFSLLKRGRSARRHRDHCPWRPEESRKLSRDNFVRLPECACELMPVDLPRWRAHDSFVHTARPFLSSRECLHGEANRRPAGANRSRPEPYWRRAPLSRPCLRRSSQKARRFFFTARAARVMLPWWAERIVSRKSCSNRRTARDFIVWKD